MFLEVSLFHYTRGSPVNKEIMTSWQVTEKDITKIVSKNITKNRNKWPYHCLSNTIKYIINDGKCFCKVKIYMVPHKPWITSF